MNNRMQSLGVYLNTELIALRTCRSLASLFLFRRGRSPYTKMLANGGGVYTIKEIPIFENFLV